MEGFCRACLNKFNESTELIQYCESNRRLFVYCTGLQVKRNDTFTFQLCKECYLNLKFSCKFKKQCRTSDKRFKSYLAQKKDRESIDFSSYLKNIEDTLTLRLPITSSSSTPAHQRNDDDDDDNVSTCTSIQNFMSDMLEGEEMLPTEARIIREVIQEEADILDDSLDSHWLQDEISIDNDFEMAYDFAGFSTPRSINNDHCYTPRKLTNEKEDEPYYHFPKDTIQKSEEAQVADQKDMPLLEIDERDVRNREYDVKNIIDPYKQEMNTSNQNDMPLLDDCDIELDGIVEDNIIMDDLESGYSIECAEKLQPNKQITVVLNKGVASKVTISPLTNELEYYMNEVEPNRSIIKTSDNDTVKLLSNENNINTVLSPNNADAINQTLLTQDFEQYIDITKLNRNEGENIEILRTGEYSPVKYELDQYINKAEMKKKRNIATNQDKNNKICKEKCSIDRNLETALKNDISQEFSLDQLLISPQVSIQSGSSTPTINNILFGNLTPRDTGTIEPDFPSKVKKELNPTDFIEEFLKDDWPRQSTPNKAPKEVERRQYIRVKDLNKLKESKVETQRKINKGVSKDWKEPTKTKHKKQNKPNRGYKDVKKLKDLLKFENENLYESSDIEMLDSEQSHTTEQIDETESINNLPKNDDNDLDLNISKLINYDDNQSVDLNISISSDFLKDEKLDGDNEKASKDPEHLFKMPFSPPDNKYDLDKNLCKICDKSYKSQGALKMHFVKIHKQQLPKAKKNINVVKRVCPQCGKGFRDNSNFNRHMKSHDEPDNFKCIYCTLDFPTRGRFNQHMRSHASELSENNEQDKDDNDSRNKQCEEEGRTTKRHVCSTCGKVFKSVGNLNVHVRRHNRNYTFKCEICDKGFVRKYDLNVHMNSHNREPAFACQHCPKKYRSRYLLVGHMYRHLGKEKFNCEVCNRQFVSSQYLKQHFRTEMCLKNRKALEEGQQTAEVVVEYKPFVNKPSKTPEAVIADYPENETKDELMDVKTGFCLELNEEEEIKNEPSPSPKPKENT